MKPFENKSKSEQNNLIKDDEDKKIIIKEKKQTNSITQNKILKVVSNSNSDSNSCSDFDSDSNSCSDSDDDVEQTSLKNLGLNKDDLVQIDIRTKDGKTHWIHKQTFKVYSNDGFDGKWSNADKNLLKQCKEEIAETIENIKKQENKNKKVRTAKTIK